MVNRSVLCAEDDELARLVIKEKLEARNWTVLEARNGNEAFSLYEKHSPDLIILDVDMPGMNGLEVLQLIRSRDMHTPVVIYSSLAREEDLKAGYASGAKVYLVKDYSIDVLIAQVESLTGGEEMKTISLGKGVSYDFSSATLTLDGQSVKFTALEGKVFALLCRNLNKLSSREILIKAGWGNSTVDSSRQLNKVINKFRNILLPFSSVYIETDKGNGYWMKTR